MEKRVGAYIPYNHKQGDYLEGLIAGTRNPAFASEIRKVGPMNLPWMTDTAFYSLAKKNSVSIYMTRPFS